MVEKTKQETEFEPDQDTIMCAVLQIVPPKFYHEYMEKYIKEAKYVAVVFDFYLVYKLPTEVLTQ